jgi:hypothetical protein
MNTVQNILSKARRRTQSRWFPPQIWYVASEKILSSALWTSRFVDGANCELRLLIDHLRWYVGGGLSSRLRYACHPSRGGRQ